MVTSPVTSLPATDSGVLVVEGQDDKHMVWHLCRRYPGSFSGSRSGYDLSVTLRSKDVPVRIVEAGNRLNLIGSIRNWVNSPTKQPIGFVLDADNDIDQCWSDILAGFKETDVELPPQPDPAGTIILEREFTPRTGIWLMPDNKSRGETEDFILSMIPRDDPVWPSASSYINDLPQSAVKFALEKAEKAKLHAWLATRSEPGRVGAAIGACDLEIDVPLCKAFITWLLELFR